MLFLNIVDIIIKIISLSSLLRGGAEKFPAWFTSLKKFLMSKH